jgi:hypothetical protein
MENAGKLRRMSQEDLDRSKVRSQEEYVECRRHLANLNAEARRSIELLEGVCRFLRGDDQRLATGGLEETLTKKLIDLMSDLRETRQRREVLHKTLVDMGLDLKDLD